VLIGCCGDVFFLRSLPSNGSTRYNILSYVTQHSLYHNFEYMRVFIVIFQTF
jgi:hypothetical protein